MKNLMLYLTYRGIIHRPPIKRTVTSLFLVQFCKVLPMLFMEINNIIVLRVPPVCYFQLVCQQSWLIYEYHGNLLQPFQIFRIYQLYHLLCYVLVFQISFCRSEPHCGHRTWLPHPHFI